MGNVISQKTWKARKDYHDDSTEFIQNGLLDKPCGTGLTFAEWRAIAKLKANNWKIKKGQLYIRQYNVQDGRTYTFKTLPDILAICIKYELYVE